MYQPSIAASRRLSGSRAGPLTSLRSRCHITPQCRCLPPSWPPPSPPAPNPPSRSKLLFVEPLSQEALTAGIESGVRTFVFQGSDDTRARTAEWALLGRFEPIIVNPDGAIKDVDGTVVGHQWRLTGAAEVKAMEAAAAAGQLEGLVLMDACGVEGGVEWKLIPAENLVALLQQQTEAGNAKSCSLLAVVETADEAGAMLGALEAGTTGVVLRTGSADEVRALASSMATVSDIASDEPLPLTAVKVTRVSVLPGRGDRVCVDLSSLMAPGEGMLVGNFASGLFLVQSECEESAYINSRPFRVNAGPVHAYVHGLGGRTCYLSELRSGDTAVVVDPQGRSRTALVGRIKVESRPLLLIEAEGPDGRRVSLQVESRPLLLIEAEGPNGRRVSLQVQNAETVKLLGPAAPAAATAAGAVDAGGPVSGRGRERQGPSTGAASTGASTGASSASAAGGTSGTGAAKSWRAVSVSSIKPGDTIYALLQGGARHTGMPIDEFIIEK
ncbi:hypothetical protein FOA52_004968 [Chlamydomonas sp. UWO 241]|nr:hypothetical protein FOA52_004968 [Chlamydomonas sp. UWO 241]